ncbi:Cytochrome P450 monooxygenase 1 [Cladobotryum mycophilum]|uniref:Cytochrome P450 monooxygenase 1 n=1 Tax=Cladobotryum mycophilum TaxID=491253 RepID=A0ABR0SIM9_9HYPO
MAVSADLFARVQLDIRPLLSLSPAVGIALLISLVCVGYVHYNLWLHPLKDFPGPFLGRATGLYRVGQLINGNVGRNLSDMHDQYGDVVRIGPNELSFISPDAWNDIRGIKNAKMSKPSLTHGLFDDEENVVVFGSSLNHVSKLRRLVAPGLSRQALDTYEPFIVRFTDLLVERLTEKAKVVEKPVNLRDWSFMWAFDIAGNVVLSTDFHNLEERRLNPWCRGQLTCARAMVILQVLLGLGLKWLTHAISGHWIVRDTIMLGPGTNTMLKKRMNLGKEKVDVVGGLLFSKDPLVSTDLALNTSVLTLAASQTTAAFLTASFCLLCQNPEAFQKLKDEIRTTFSDTDYIGVASTEELPYLDACLQETLRLYPPTPLGIARVAPEGAHRLLGTLSLQTFAVNHSAKNFKNPHAFHPERFLGDEAYSGDALNGLQPFSVGPRNCIGKGLALAEVRIALVKLIMKFDMELAPDSVGWFRGQKMYFLWNPPPMNVYLKPVQG